VKEKTRNVKRNIVDLCITNGYVLLTRLQLQHRDQFKGLPVRSQLQIRYDELVAQGEIRHDPAQVQAVAELENLRHYLDITATRRAGLMASFTGRHRPDAPKGVYLWGGVGSGKSMLMDLFFDTTNIERKRRVHFHAFMQEIHDAIHKARQKGTSDPINPVAKAVAAQARLLCFDEMQITDITDAMIVGRLFENLLRLGTTIVTTSNREPGDLYKNGLNRQLFLPFIALIRSKMTVHHLQSEVDYRQDRLRGQKTWFTPLGAQSTAELDRIWQELTNGQGEILTLRVKNRAVSLANFHNGIARASFAELCQKPLGPADFLAIANAARVLVLDDIPRMSRAKNNEAKRFVTLIDTLYEGQVQLIASAETEPEDLYMEGAGAFEFERTASRLREIQSADWGGKTG
jgi:cell division protein ZapE